MVELNESRVREIIRDELSVMQVPEKLTVIEEQNRFILETLNQKADKTEMRALIEALRQEMTGQINSLEEKMTGQISSLEEKMTGQISSLEEKMTGQINSLKVEQALTRDFIKYNSRLTTGFFITITVLLIGLLIRPMFL